MAVRDDVSSTEKLLDVIRGDSSADAPVTGVTMTETPAQRAESSLRRMLAFKRKVTVGLDMSEEALRLVKLAKVGKQQWQLLGFRHVSLNPQLSRSSPEFVTFLKGLLNDFCGYEKDLELWSSISHSRVDAWHVRIPRVPKKQVGAAVYWTARKEVAFDEKESVFDFEVQSEFLEKGVPRMAALVYVAPRAEVEEMRDLLARTGYHLTGITLPPFAFQNMLRTGWIAGNDGTSVILYIGNDFSHIDILSRDSLVLTRTIKSGINSIAEALVEGINERSKDALLELEDEEPELVMEPASASASIPGVPTLTLEQARELLSRLGLGVSLLGDTHLDPHLSQEDMLAIVKPAVERLIRQLERTLQHYSTKLRGAEAEASKIFISGNLDPHGPLVNYIGEQLGIEWELLDRMGPGPHLAGEVRAAAASSDRIAYGPALGLALSDSGHTPNLLFTYKAKEKLAEMARLSRYIFMGFMVCMAAFLGIYWYQADSNADKKATIARLQNELNQYVPRVNESFILGITSKVKHQHLALKHDSKRYLGLAVISELAGLTPANIRLTSISANLQQAAVKGQQGSGRTVIVDGMVVGDQRLFESSLARYLMKIENSPLFSNAVVHASTTEADVEQGRILLFTLRLKLV